MNADTYEAVGVTIDETQPFGGYTEEELVQRLQHEFRITDKRNKGKVREDDFKLALMRVRQLRMTDRYADRMFLTAHVLANPHEHVCQRNRDNIIIFEGNVVLWKEYLEQGLEPLRLLQRRRLLETPLELRNAGTTVPDFMQAGIEHDVQQAGFSIVEARDAGFDTIEGLERAGFHVQALKEMNVKHDAFSEEDLQGLRQSGFPAMVLRKKFKCSCKQLRAGRYAVVDIVESGIWGVKGATLLREAGYTVEEMIQDFTVAQLRSGGFTASELQRGGVSLKKIRESGTITALELREAGFSAVDLREAYFTAMQMKDAGFSARELKEAGYTAAQLKYARYLASELKEAGYNTAEMRHAGLTAADLKRLSYLPEQLREGGYSARDMQAGGFSVNSMRQAGFSAVELREAGYQAQELRAVGLNCNELLQAGFSSIALKNAGCTPSELFEAGVGVAELRDIGYDVDDVFGATAGKITVKQLLEEAGFTPKELKDAGRKAKELLDAGVSVRKCRVSGYSAGDLKEAGVPVDDMKRNGYSAKELVVDAGFTDAKELRLMGFKFGALKLAGFSDRTLVLEAKFTVQEVLKATGYSAFKLSEAGFTPSELKAAGFDADTLVKAGSLWAPPGVHNQVPESVLDGWELHRIDPYEHATSDKDLISIPEESHWVLVAARKKNSTVLHVAAAAPRSAVLTKTALNQTHESNGVFWYRCPRRAFGFSNTRHINLGGVADWYDPESDQRLSWVLDHNDWGGRRAGSHCDLAFDDTWEKCVWFS